MADIDPDTLLEWLTMGQGDERDMQLIALEQLCMLLLMSDNVDRCFESCPPRTFLPALCHIFMDETAPDNILEVTARAITYYLDVSAECSRRIVSVDGAVKALCTRLVVVDIGLRTSKDLAEQCVKVLELMCTREAGAIYEAGGLTCILTFIREYGSQIHKDTLHSAMSVVARLCTKMEPTDQSLEDCVDSLSLLLKHEDNSVADGALRCFACLADRFTRRGVDPAPLAKHGLTNVLLEKLATSALAYAGEKSGSLPGASPDQKSNSGNVSIIVSVLSTLCRGSPTVTHDLLRSDLLDAIDKAMQGDERCILDTIRLIDLLLVLLFEGRDALPKSSSFSSRSGLPGLRRMDSSAERSHRQLIDCIRSKDTDALIEAIDSGTFEVNFMDDVGQTLLNWASAFGTLEMVEFLCERGSDVNRGQRSSSLHYAACFGRPAVAKVLLRYGANPDLRDEDGKTPLDKARERNDEGHKEVVRILQSPGEWMVPAGESQETESATGSSTEEVSTTTKDQETAEPKESVEPQPTEPEEPIVKGDPEMAPVYLKRLLPIFAQAFRSSLLLSIRKATLAILKKMIHYIPPEMMEEVVTSSSVATQIIDVVSAVISNEDDDEGHLTAFQCVEDLMSKGKETFLVHFVRLGVLNRITEMAQSYKDGDSDALDGALKAARKEAEIMPQEDAITVVPGKPYHWHDWCIVRGRDCLYLWSDFCAVELSNGSNGWFRFILDGKLATMYSSGSPEGGSGSSESRTEFLEKLQRARSQVSASTLSQPILSSPSPTRLVVGNWSLACNQTGQVTIHNADGQQATILKEDLPGFVFESNRGTKHTFTAETSLGTDFATTWSGKPGRKYQSKKEQLKQRLSVTAHDIYQKYFKEAEHGTYGAMGKLREISKSLTEASQGIEVLSVEEKGKIHAALKELCQLLHEESMLSSYEIQSSGLVTALFNCLNRAPYVNGTINRQVADETSTIFKSVFGETIQNVSGDESLHYVSLAVALVKKLIGVLETVEKLPVLKYEHAGGGSGLQALLRRLRFRLERDSKSVNLIDRSTKYLKMEPLTTVAEIERYLLKMVAKQWYDYERSTYKFIQVLKDDALPLIFSHSHDFDENGVIYWIGTNSKTVPDWVNPAEYGLIAVSSSEGRNLPYGRPEDILHRDTAALNCHTNDDKTAWFTIDLGLWFIPTSYTLRHARGYGRSALRNWLFQGSKDGQNWTTLCTHQDNHSLNEPGSTATWPVNCSSDESQGWRLFRIQQAGPNASGQTHYLSLSGFEMYGTIKGVADEPPGTSLPEGDSALRKQRRLFRSQVLRQMALGGKEGTDLKTLRERAKQLSSGLDVAKSDSKSEGWVDVSWVQNTAAALQKLSSDDQLNVKVVDISDPEVQAAISEADKSVEDVKACTESRNAYDTALKSVVDSLGKRDSKINTRDSIQDTLKPESLSPHTRSRSESDDSGISRGLSADLANLRLLMAVEDLLDNASSDLVASALAEAASLDQLRAAARNLRSSFLQSSGGRLVPSSQGSRESTSPPSEPLDVQNLNIDGKRDKNVSGSTSRDSPVPLAVVEEDCASDSSDEDDEDDDDDSWADHIKPSTLVKSSLIFNKESIESDISFKENNEIAEVRITGSVDKGQESGSCKAVAHESIGNNIVVRACSDGSENVKNSCLSTDTFSDPWKEDAVDTQARNISQVGSQEFLSVDSNQVDITEKSYDNKIDEMIYSRKHGDSETVENEFFDARSDEISRDTLGMFLVKEGMQQNLEIKKKSDVAEKGSVSTIYIADAQNQGNNDIVNVSNSAMSLEPSISKLVLETMLELGIEQTHEEFVVGEANGSKIDKECSQTSDMPNGVDSIKSEIDVTAKIEEERSSKERTEVGKTTSGLQTCSFLVDMEDDDMDDYHMDDGDDEDEFEDIENEDENDPEELYEPMPVQPPETTLDRQADNRRRLWDDDYVLKRQHSALIPAFDPRPGRTNVAQTQDVDIPDIGNIKGTAESSGTRLKLFLKSSSSSAGKETEIPLEDSNASIFSYAQKMALLHSGISDVPDKQRRVWEPTYTIVYRSSDIPQDAVLPVEEEPLEFSKWKIEEDTNKKEKTQKEEDSKQSCGLDKEESRLSAILHKGVTSNSVCELLDLLKSIHKLSEENNERVSLSDDYIFDVPEEEFISKKLTNKLQQQIQDPLVLTTGSLPAWCDYLVINYPMLFPFETRQMYFQATAFGCSRSIVWLQNMQDATLERNRGHPTRRLEPHEFRIGRLKHERVRVPRGEGLLEFAMKALQFHADRKAILEIEFKDEEGTGLGPSLEFYALVAREIQKKELGLWVASDILVGNIKEIGSENQDSNVGVYVHHPNGLFPAPYPRDHPKMEYLCKMYNFFGIFLAKCLQDNRLVDIPLSGPFYKLLCLDRPTSRKISSYSINDVNDVDNLGSPRSTTSSEDSFECDFYRTIFSDCDFEMIYPELNEFIEQLRKFVQRKKKIEQNDRWTQQEKKDKTANLLFETRQGHKCKLDDLGLTFQYIPPSKAYGFESIDLKSDGDSEMLSADNAEDYIELMTEFCLFKGIRRQVEAFEAGFNRVFPMDKLHAFNPREIQRMLCGEQAPQWTKDDLMNYTEPKFGYTRESSGFLRLVNVLLNFTGEERKLFLQFATGCSSLPPGGLANLHPRLTVVKKDGEGDGSYPSVNTCVHYLKLPEYSSEVVLRAKLLAATIEKGFHLN